MDNKSFPTIFQQTSIMSPKISTFGDGLATVLENCAIFAMRFGEVALKAGRIKNYGKNLYITFHKGEQRNWSF